MKKIQSGDLTVDKNGNLLITYHYYSFPQWELVRLVFDGNASFYQELPLVFLEQ